MDNLTDKEFADMYLYILATSLSNEQVAQAEIDNKEEEVEDED